MGQIREGVRHVEVGEDQAGVRLDNFLTSVKTLETKGNWRNENMHAFDQKLQAATARYPNIQVYDWSSVVQDAWFSKDKIHYTSAGYAQRAHLIAQALATQIPA